MKDHTNKSSSSSSTSNTAPSPGWDWNPTSVEWGRLSPDAKARLYALYKALIRPQRPTDRQPGSGPDFPIEIPPDQPEDPPIPALDDFIPRVVTPPPQQATDHARDGGASSLLHNEDLQNSETEVKAPTRYTPPSVEMQRRRSRRPFRMPADGPAEAAVVPLDTNNPSNSIAERQGPPLRLTRSPSPRPQPQPQPQAQDTTNALPRPTGRPRPPPLPLAPPPRRRPSTQASGSAQDLAMPPAPAPPRRKRKRSSKKPCLCRSESWDPAGTRCERHNRVPMFNPRGLRWSPFSPIFGQESKARIEERKAHDAAMKQAEEDNHQRWISYERARRSRAADPKSPAASVTPRNQIRGTPPAVPEDDLEDRVLHPQARRQERAAFLDSPEPPYRFEPRRLDYEAPRQPTEPTEPTENRAVPQAAPQAVPRTLPRSSLAARRGQNPAPLGLVPVQRPWLPTLATPDLVSANSVDPSPSMVAFMHQVGRNGMTRYEAGELLPNGDQSPGTSRRQAVGGPLSPFQSPRAVSQRIQQARDDSDED